MVIGIGDDEAEIDIVIGTQLAAGRVTARIAVAAGVARFESVAAKRSVQDARRLPNSGGILCDNVCRTPLEKRIFSDAFSNRRLFSSSRPLDLFPATGALSGCVGDRGGAGSFDREAGGEGGSG